MASNIKLVMMPINTDTPTLEIELPKHMYETVSHLVPLIPILSLQKKKKTHPDAPKIQNADDKQGNKISLPPSSISTGDYRSAPKFP